jgi:hypothetical protein
MHEAALDKRLADLAEKLYKEALWDILCDDPVANEVSEEELDARARELAIERAREQLEQPTASRRLT